jgi:hypothetical protein
MKYKYCPECRKAYIKSRLEGDRCIYCSSMCETLDVRRNCLYYFGYAFMLAGAVGVLAPRFVETEADAFFIYMGLAAVVAGMVFVVMGSMRMAKKAAEMALAHNEKKD